MSAPRRIWVTRTRPQADATAASLRAMGLEAVVEPVLAVRTLAEVVVDPSGADAIAFTSGHAVRAFARLCANRDLPVFTVGAATAGLARSLGFETVHSADGDVAALARLIADAKPRPTLVLNPTALEPVADLGALLTVQGLKVRRVAVYETVEAPVSPALADITAVLIHSPKAGRAVAALISADQARRLSAYAISEAAAAPLRALPFASVFVAPFPTEAALLNLLQG